MTTMLSPETTDFIRDLAANNDREWFNANRQRYEECFKRPAEQFAEAMANEIQVAIGLTCSSRIFRIYRDVRFSRDKTPYNAHLHIGFPVEGSDGDAPCLMFAIEPERAVLGTGVLGFSKEGLDRYRERVAGKDGDKLQVLLDAACAAGARMGEPELKRVPAPYPADHLHSELLRRKSLAVWRDYADQTFAYGPDGPKNCTKELMQLREVFDFLRS